MENGGEKYGQMNWRDNPVIGSIYYDACMRHLLSYLDGEDFARDSKVRHLAHAMASIAILIDAELNGNLIDDRPTKGPVADVIDKITSERTNRNQG